MALRKVVGDRFDLESLVVDPFPLIVIGIGMVGFLLIVFKGDIIKALLGSSIVFLSLAALPVVLPMLTGLTWGSLEIQRQYALFSIVAFSSAGLSVLLLRLYNSKQQQPRQG